MLQSKSFSPGRLFAAAICRTPVFTVCFVTLFVAGTRLYAQQLPDTIRLSGVLVPLTTQGLPDQIYVDSIPVLAENIHFHFTRQTDGKDIRLSPEHSDMAGMPRRYFSGAQLRGAQYSPELAVGVSARTYHDSLLFTIPILVLEDVELKDLTFHIPMEKRIAKYISGLGVQGGLRPDTVAWRWNDAPDHRATAWIGDTHAGLWFSLTSSLPGNPGGLLVAVKGRSMLVDAYTGPLSLKKGETVIYHFTFVPTRKPPKGVHLSE